jgi:hypothetical protein
MGYNNVTGVVDCFTCASNSNYCEQKTCYIAEIIIILCWLFALFVSLVRLNVVIFKKYQTTDPANELYISTKKTIFIFGLIATIAGIIRGGILILYTGDTLNMFITMFFFARIEGLGIANIVLTIALSWSTLLNERSSKRLDVGSTKWLTGGFVVFAMGLAILERFEPNYLFATWWAYYGVLVAIYASMGGITMLVNVQPYCKLKKSQLEQNPVLKRIGRLSVMNIIVISIVLFIAIPVVIKLTTNQSVIIMVLTIILIAIVFINADIFTWDTSFMEKITRNISFVDQSVRIPINPSYRKSDAPPQYSPESSPSAPPIDASARFCPSCTRPVVAGTNFCPTCGTMYP